MQVSYGEVLLVHVEFTKFPVSIALCVCVCVCESYIGKPIGTHAVPQFTTGVGGKATNTDRTRKKLSTIHQLNSMIMHVQADTMM